MWGEIRARPRVASRVARSESRTVSFFFTDRRPPDSQKSIINCGCDGRLRPPVAAPAPRGGARGPALPRQQDGGVSCCRALPRARAGLRARPKILECRIDRAQGPAATRRARRGRRRLCRARPPRRRRRPPRCAPRLSRRLDRAARGRPRRRARGALPARAAARVAPTRRAPRGARLGGGAARRVARPRARRRARRARVPRAHLARLCAAPVHHSWSALP